MVNTSSDSKKQGLPASFAVTDALGSTGSIRLSAIAVVVAVNLNPQWVKYQPIRWGDLHTHPTWSSSQKIPGSQVQLYYTVVESAPDDFPEIRPTYATS